MDTENSKILVKPSNLFAYSADLQSNEPQEYAHILEQLINTHPVIKVMSEFNPLAFYIFSYLDLTVKYVSKNIFGSLFRVPEAEIVKHFQEQGMRYTFSRMHPSDLKILTEDCFRLAEEILKDIPISLRDKIRYSNNYRALRGDNTYGKFLSQFCVVPDIQTGYPLIGIGTITDITDQKIDNRIIFKAEFYDELHGHREVVKEFWPEDDLFHKLSDREIEVAIMLAQGKKTEEIAEKLFLSPYTVRAHKRNIFEKTGVHKATELATIVGKMGLIL